MRDVLTAFVGELGIAETTLAEIENGLVHLPLNIGLIRLDLDSDGRGSEAEALWRIFQAVTQADWLTPERAKGLLADFDQSDVPWLRAYCHLLMAMAEFPLAHDWERAFEVTFPSIFPMPGAAGDKLNEAADRSEVTGIADLIAFIHLADWPVAEPERMRSVLEHLEDIVRLGRENWALILAETDKGAEWIPNPNQVGVLPRCRWATERLLLGDGS